MAIAISISKIDFLPFRLYNLDSNSAVIEQVQQSMDHFADQN